MSSTAADMGTLAAPPLPVAFQDIKASSHPMHLHQLASTVLHNLQHQHDWSLLCIHAHTSSSGQLLSRPVISGLPPRRAYIHPDEQVATLKFEHETGTPVKQFPEREWVLPTHLGERWSLKQFAAMFDALDTVPPVDEKAAEEESAVGQEWQGKNRQKRILLATLHDDSTIVYYIMHDGIVKPRQN